MLQAVLGTDQQALIYHITDDEVLAFLIDRQNAKVVRRLCSLAALQAAQTELDFQLGRAELGSAYLTRHATRLQTALRAALFKLYQLLIAPVADQRHDAVERSLVTVDDRLIHACLLCLLASCVRPLLGMSEVSKWPIAYWTYTWFLPHAEWTP